MKMQKLTQNIKHGIYYQMIRLFLQLIIYKSDGLPISLYISITIITHQQLMKNLIKFIFSILLIDITGTFKKFKSNSFHVCYKIELLYSKMKTRFGPPKNLYFRQLLIDKFRNHLHDIILNYTSQIFKSNKIYESIIQFNFNPLSVDAMIGRKKEWKKISMIII
ncbi:hypothetical protein pb186bvf_014474 [Paramecium bursaria]